MEISADKLPAKPGPVTPASPPRGRILCAEDDAPTRELFKRILTSAGFVVDTATDGLEAWESLQSQPFDLLLSDHEMPRLTGLELIRHARQARMTLPIILTSGMLGALRLDEQPSLDGVAMLAKPFTPQQLIALVQEVLRSEADAKPGENVPAMPGRNDTRPPSASK